MRIECAICPYISEDEEDFEKGFGGLTTIIGVSMIIYFIWVGILGCLMWRKSMSKSNC
jgi:hypothetical protein